MLQEVFGELRERMERHVRDRGVGGLAWAVSVADEVESGAAGWLDPDRRQRPMPVDGVFRIASVSKPIVATAALQLVDAGLIGLDDPIDDVLVELADRRVLIDPAGSLDQPTVPAERSLTLRDLLTFRCGFGMELDGGEPPPLLERLWELGIGPGPTPPAWPPDEFMTRLGALPLADQPGARWRYHTGSDIVSVLVERVRGRSLDAVLARDVLAPIGATDTGFWARTDQLDRFGASRAVGDDGTLAVWDEPEGRWATPPAFRSGATGLVSTAADLVSFGQMLLRGGEGRHGRVLSHELVEEMTTDQLTDQQRSIARIDGESSELGWGLGLGVRHDVSPIGWPAAGSLEWDGGLGSRWIVDPTCDLCAVLLITDAFSADGTPAVLVDFVDAIAATPSIRA